MSVKQCVVILAGVGFLGMMAAAQQQALAPQANFAAELSVSRVEPNYNLAAAWAPSKVSTMVFDTSVTPHWFTTSDKFWYSYKTSSGTAYYVVDPVKGTKSALFDHAKLAAQLTRILQIPYDGEHLPIRNLRLIDHDTAMSFEVAIARTAVVPGLPPETAAERARAQQNQDQNGGGGGRGGRGGTAAAPPPGTRTVYFHLDLATQQAQMLPNFTPPQRQPSWAQLSPDRKTVVFSRNHNLYMMDAASYALALKNPNDPAVKETQLTTDGAEYYSYGRDQNFGNGEDLGTTGGGRGGRGAGRGGRGGAAGASANTQRDTSKYPRKPAVRIVWSKDSSKFALERSDERKVGFLWVIHSLHNPRPTLETYKYAMPGDANVTENELWIFDVASQKGLKASADAFPDQRLSIQTAPVTNRERDTLPPGQQAASVWLGGANGSLYVERISRDMHKVDYCTVSTSDGAVKPIIEERENVYIMTKPLRLVDHGQDLLVWSERDGWGHYYLYGTDGTLKHQVDKGEFVAGNIVSTDDATAALYFGAYGFKSGENVYDSHLYRIGYNGAGMQALDAGSATHALSASDDGKYFVDTSSRVDTAPTSDLDGDTGRLLHLETTDVTALKAAGYQYPTPFTVKAADGITNLYGVMFKPFNFDAHKKYPLIEYVYPGPQTESVESTFNPKSAQVQLAQFGFIVIEVGNRGGSPERDSWYHTYGYHNLRDYGLADKKRAAEELAQMYPFIDINRVGITGHSGGGFMSTAAILEYPDFFKVAVSESGNHDNNIYNNTWSEEHNGIEEVDGKDGKATFTDYKVDTNVALAANLKGHLLLSTGDMDNNVNMSNTMRLVNALIRANKRFDLVVLPGERHGYSSDTEYFFWRKADYFCQYLLGASPHDADMDMLQREVAETGKKAAAAPGGGNN